MYFIRTVTTRSHDSVKIIFPGYCVNSIGIGNKTTVDESILLQIKHDNVIISYDLPLSAASRGSNNSAAIREQFQCVQQSIVDSTTIHR